MDTIPIQSIFIFFFDKFNSYDSFSAFINANKTKLLFVIGFHWVLNINFKIDKILAIK